jgi:hypothetical protein
MNTAEIAAQLVAMTREKRFVECVDSLYGDNVVSVEALDYQGQGREEKGKDAVRAKNSAWVAENEVHRVDVTGPFVSPEKFAVLFDMDWTRRATGERVSFREVAVYTVADGRIVREEFLYGQ